MSDPRFLQQGFEKQLAHLVEECGEVLAAAGKTQRWGVDSVNPLLPPDEQETNGMWLRRELKDLREAMDRLLATMDEQRAEAYCKPCNAVGIRNCANFDECAGAACITCHRPLNELASMPTVSREELARMLCSAHSGSDPHVHCNRFPNWDELSGATKVRWRTVANIILARFPHLESRG